MKVNQTVVLVGLAAVAAAAAYWFVIRPGAKAAIEAAQTSNNIGRWTNPFLDTLTSLAEGPMTDESPITGPYSLGYRIGATIRGWFTSDDQETASASTRPYDYGTGSPGIPLRPTDDESPSYFQFFGT